VRAHMTYREPPITYRPVPRSIPLNPGRYQPAALRYERADISMRHDDIRSIRPKIRSNQAAISYAAAPSAWPSSSQTKVAPSGLTPLARPSTWLRSR
jgi:hypothetical protein